MRLKQVASIDKARRKPAQKYPLKVLKSKAAKNNYDQLFGQYMNPHNYVLTKI